MISGGTAAPIHPKAVNIGAALWILSFQFFVVQAVTASAWRVPYSLINNTISDLGNTQCALYVGRYVCSPLHVWMNVSLILLGFTMASGSVLVHGAFPKTIYNRLAFGAMALGGVGTMFVGLFSENTVPGLHAWGAALPFLVGNIALLVFGLSLKLPRVLKYYTLLSGLFPLTALGLFIGRYYLGIGEGGMERIVAHPQTVWLIVFGIYALRRQPQTPEHS